MRLVLLFSILILATSCNTVEKALVGSCIEVGGSYKGAGGAVKYCFKKVATQKNGIPTLAGKDGKENYIVSKGQVKKINKLLDAGKKFTRALSAGGIKLSPIKKLISHIGGK